MKFSQYCTDGYFDELFEAGGEPRQGARLLIERLEALENDELERRRRAAETAMLQMGITFNVYGDEAQTDRVWPFDLIPRIICHQDWQRIEAGLRQRIYALNLFVQDVYNDAHILYDGIVPRELVESCQVYRKACMGLNPPHGIWCHVSGTDLVRDKDGTWYILEDNLRCPSGVSYVLENREVLKRTFPQILQSMPIRQVDDYPNRLLHTLTHLAAEQFEHPRIVVLTPGVYNSAYFEHSFLAQQMGVDLVEGRDLIVKDGYVHMRTTHGFERVDVIYRRIDDDFLDPQAFRADSMLGVPGLMEVYRAGRVALANAPGTGIADDKAIYAYVPRIIEYYLKEEPILDNVPTYICNEPDAIAYVLDNIQDLVVKPVNESGGYGLMIGPHADKAEHRSCKEKIRENPRNYIAQPMLSLSRVPILTDDGPEGRHVDLRPFVLYGEDIYVQPGGLTRVALPKGSIVVNSSQGGGSKDTWVLQENAPAMSQTAFQSAAS